jgi:hypothetical protein
MDHTKHIPVDTEMDRSVNNQMAWKNLSGYRSSSGSACWDRSRYLCIPKHTGWGYNMNFWCFFCCFMCEEVQVQSIPADFQSKSLAARHSVVNGHPTKAENEYHDHEHNNDDDNDQQEMEMTENRFTPTSPQHQRPLSEEEKQQEVQSFEEKNFICTLRVQE